MRNIYLSLMLVPIISTAFAQNVGIGTTSPNQKFEVAGWIELGNETEGTTGTAGAIRYHSSGKIQYHDGITWRDIISSSNPQAGDNLGNHTATTNLNMSNYHVDNVTQVDVTSGVGNGIRFWSSDSYAINMGNTAEYQYGNVTDYSIKMNMNNQSNRGWTWGVDGLTPVASINTQGHMHMAGDLTVNGNDINMVRGDLSGIHRVGEISFDWTSGSYDNAEYHGIQSRNESGALGDELRINSYNDIITTIDANNNDATSYFKVQEHSSTNGNDLFWVRSSDGWAYHQSRLGIGNTSPSEMLDVSGNTRTTGDFIGRIAVEDTRSTNDAPNTYDKEVHFEFKSRSAVGVGGSGTYGGMMTIAPWGDDSGDAHHQLNFNEGGIFWRQGQPNSTVWGSWEELATQNWVLSNGDNLGNHIATMGIKRNNHNTGHLEGSYNNVGSNDGRTNPIYTIGANYNPSATTLDNMYGIGYTHSNFWGSGSDMPGGWGQYVAADGDIRIILEASNGNIWASGTVRANGGVRVDGNVVIDDGAGWHRSYGNTGWYNGTYAGGWYMTDATWIRNYNSKPIWIVGNGSTAAGFDNGYVGIGTSGPSYPLHVTEPISANWQARFTNGASNVYMAHSTGYGMHINTGATNSSGRYALEVRNASQTHLYVRDDGYIGVGTTSLSQKLTVNGRVKSNGINETSDIRMKKNIEDLEGSLDKVLQLRGVTYDWRTDEFPEQGFDEGRQLGVIAQEIEAIVPEVVCTDDEGYKSVEYSHLVPLLIEAIKEQQQTIDAQQARINNLEEGSDEMATLKAENEALKADVEEIKALLKMQAKK